MSVRENIYMNPVAHAETACCELVWRADGARRTRRRAEALLGQGRRTPNSRSRRSPAATSRRSWSPAGWRPRSGCSCWRSRRSASTSARRRRSTASCSSRCGRGMAVLLISSDFEEVERICHRALVFSRGRVVAEIPRRRVDDRAADGGAAGGSPADSAWRNAMSSRSERSSSAPRSLARSPSGACCFC